MNLRIEEEGRGGSEEAGTAHRERQDGSYHRSFYSDDAPHDGQGASPEVDQRREEEETASPPRRRSADCKCQRAGTTRRGPSLIGRSRRSGARFPPRDGGRRGTYGERWCGIGWTHRAWLSLEAKGVPRGPPPNPDGRIGAGRRRRSACIRHCRSRRPPPRVPN